MKRKNNIPKIIHYCWFGKGEKPELAIKCINSWKEKLPDYKLVEWNEENFDINCNKYVKEAYENKKYAFVTDYVRLYVLYNYGGIYMDTDVEVLKSLDEFLIHHAFSGFENNNSIPTGIMAAEKGNKWIKLLLDEYDNLSFVKDDGTLDTTTNVIRITNNTQKNYNIKLDDTYQDLKDVVFYPHEYFCPKDWVTGNIYLTDKTYVIHHFNASWHTPKEKKENEIRLNLIKKYGKELGSKKYEKRLKKKRITKYIFYPFKAIIHPKKAINKLKRVINHEV